MDGPLGLVSIRTLAVRSVKGLLGSYDATCLRKQAVGM
jgi:hypothetical protein